MTHRLTRAIMNRHREGHGDELSKSWGADNAPRPSRLTDIARLLAISGQGVPTATQMSPEEITEAIESGIDPYAVAIDGTAVRQALHPPLTDLLCAIHMASWFSDCDPAVGPFPPGVTLIRVADLALLDRLEDALEFVLPFAWEALTPGPKTFPDNAVLVTLEKASSFSKSDPRDKFRESLDEALSKGLGVVALATDPSDLSEGGRMLLVRDVIWPAFDGEAVIDLLRATHSATGEVAEAELRKRLPGNDQIANLPWPVVNHAFHARTTLTVADRLASARIAANPTLHRTLDDVCGLPEVTGELRHLVEDVREWQADQLDWSDVSASILLHGPPGAGKTMIAEALAGTAGATFVATSYAEAQQAGHLGDYLRTMGQQVDRAISNAPSVFFLDELDSYRARQKSGNHFSGYMHSVVNGLLEQLTKLNEAPGVIVIAATNHPSIIDPALIRAGRFDRKIAVGLPDKDGIAAILSGHLGTDAIPLGDLSPRLVGLSGAEVAAIARNAKGLARRARETLDLHHVRSAVDQRVSRPDPEHIRRKAIHEAGHAVVGHVLGLKPGHRIFVGAVGGGYDSPVPPVMTPDIADRELAMRFGGRAAEVAFLGTVSTGSGGSEHSDLGGATALAIDLEQEYGFGPSVLYNPVAPGDRYQMPDELRDRVERRLRQAEDRARSVIDGNRHLVERVAEALIEHRELDGDELLRLLTRDEVDRPIRELS
ncbi:AAA family ATPase [Phaeobacter sp. LSS9]|uniref:AAA family ATPase n=1 Tax=unclassified Phaeobacter TaxID=2621772 RepID=UPI0013C32C51|nr:AAA family ATPase [Phaeobacter sp. LSS9]